MLLKKGLLVIVVCLLLTPVFSQSSSPYRTLKVSFGLSGFSYLGDFASGSGRLQRVYPGATIYIYTESSSPLQLQLGGGFGKFAAQYEGTPNQGNQLSHTFVETPFYFGDLRLRYRFLKGNWRPYAAIGAGILVFSPRDENGKPLKFIDESREEGETYNTIIPELPLSLGFEKTVNEILNVGFEYTLRYTPSDYLDNVGQQGSRPGKDLLHAATLTFTVSLPNKKKQASLANIDSLPKNTLLDTISSMQEGVANPDKTLSESSSPSTLQPDNDIPEIETPLSNNNIDNAQAIQAAIDENRFIYYKVKKGDTLINISIDYSIDIQMLKKVNFLKDDNLKKGSYLRIPDVE